MAVDVSQLAAVPSAGRRFEVVAKPAGDAPLQTHSDDLVSQPLPPWRYDPQVWSSLKHSLAGYFVSLLPRDPRIERVYWLLDGTLLTVWTVIDVPDGEVQQAIYSAELRFMKGFPELDCDFTVLYRFGRSEEEIRPAHANLAPHD